MNNKYQIIIHQNPFTKTNFSTKHPNYVESDILDNCISIGVKNIERVIIFKGTDDQLDEVGSFIVIPKENLDQLISMLIGESLKKEDKNEDH